VCTTPACFSTFLSINYCPYSSWKFVIFYTCLLTFFLQIVILTDWWTHTFCIIMFCVHQLYLRVKYPLRFFVCYVHPVTQQYKSKTVRKVHCNQSSHNENTMVPRAPVIVWNWSIHYTSLSAVFNSLHSSTNQELFEKHLCKESSHYEKYGRFLATQRNPSRATTKLMLFAVSKDGWNTKEDTGKSLKNTLYILQYAKRYLSGWSDSEQWKNQASSLSHYRVMLVWRHQAVS